MQLTIVQQEIISALTEQFINLNTPTTPQGGLIDVSGIVQQVNREKDFEREVNLANATFNKMKLAQFKADMESLKPDLDALGLVVHIPKEYPSAYITSKKHSYRDVVDNHKAYLYITYKNTHHIEKRCGSVVKKVDSRYGIQIGSGHFPPTYSNFEAMLRADGFKDRIKYVYERSLE